MRVWYARKLKKYYATILGTKRQLELPSPAALLLLLLLLRYYYRYTFCCYCLFPGETASTAPAPAAIAEATAATPSASFHQSSLLSRWRWCSPSPLRTRAAPQLSFLFVSQWDFCTVLFASVNIAMIMHLHSRTHPRTDPHTHTHLLCQNPPDHPQTWRQALAKFWPQIFTNISLSSYGRRHHHHGHHHVYVRVRVLSDEGSSPCHALILNLKCPLQQNTWI